MPRTGIQRPVDFDEAFTEVERQILINQSFEAIEEQIDSWLLTDDERQTLWFLLYGSTRGQEHLAAANQVT